MKGVGWSSPKGEMGPEITMLKLAKLHQVKMPRTKDEGAKMLVRALVIERLLADDPNSCKYYEDKQIKKWLLHVSMTQSGRIICLHI